MRARVILAGLLLAATVAAGWLFREVRAPGPLAAGTLVYIAPGSSVKAISAQLRQAGAIRSEFVFLAGARLNGGRSLKAGEYNFPPRASISDIIALLQSGKTWQRQVTFAEGLMVSEIVALLNAEPALQGAVDPLPAEGSLLPETYNFSYGDSRQSVVERMKKAQKETLTALWDMRAEGLPLKSPEQAAVLASIVEKETGVAEERPRVAGVFVNRLKRGIPLQSDPTVAYAVTRGQAKLERPLSLRDLKSPSPYNTYLVAGLPPGPIANPGRASLAAVLAPEKNDYLYFVADGSGGHAFAASLKEHNNNVARWRKLEKASRQSR